mmetsp:Transcript_21917/g.47947  ORF Transcript_21917/g.47947 Transcript_21917/m.47947 type:complete len:228 (-) Transcript_21917:432-1115(-)
MPHVFAALLEVTHGLLGERTIKRQYVSTQAEVPTLWHMTLVGDLGEEAQPLMDRRMKAAIRVRSPPLATELHLAPELPSQELADGEMPAHHGDHEHGHLVAIAILYELRVERCRGVKAVHVCLDEHLEHLQRAALYGEEGCAVPSLVCTRRIRMFCHALSQGVNISDVARGKASLVVALHGKELFDDLAWVRHFVFILLLLLLPLVTVVRALVTRIVSRRGQSHSPP